MCFPARAPARDNLDPPYRKEPHRVDATVATAIIRAHDVIIAALSTRLARQGRQTTDNGTTDTKLDDREFGERKQGYKHRLGAAAPGPQAAMT